MPTEVLPVRRCDRCRARLASYNRSSRCSPCAARALKEPAEVPREFWDLPAMRDALATHHMGRVIYVYRGHPWHNQVIKQSVIGSWLDLTQTQVSRIETGRAPEEMSKLIHWAVTLRVPAELLWFKLAREVRGAPPEAAANSVERADGPAGSVSIACVGDVDRALGKAVAQAINFSQVATTASSIKLLDDRVRSLARDYLTMAPLPIIQEAAAISQAVYEMLNQRQRLRDAQELHVVAAKVHAFISWVAGDLGRLPSAVAHARTSLALAEEAGHPGAAALALCSLSKAAYWSSETRGAAEYAQRGFELSPANTTRALLSCQVADATSSAAGLAAIDAAHEAFAGATEDDELGGVFGCGPTRIANYAIEAHLKYGNPERALHAAEKAVYPLPGEQVGYGTLAQIGIGRARARLAQRDLPGAAREVAPILALPPERRLVTMAGKLTELAATCEASAMAGADARALEFAGDIREYCRQSVASASAGKGAQ